MDLDQRTPEVVGGGGIIGSRCAILGERHRVGHLVGPGDDPGRRAEVRKGVHGLPVEVGDRPGRQGHAPLAALARPRDQLMGDEVEFQLEGRASVRDQRSHQAPRGRAQRHVPGVVEPWRAGQGDLADDLGPELQSSDGRSERGVGQGRPVRARAPLPRSPRHGPTWRTSGT